MSDELQGLENSQTRDLVDLPPGKFAISCKRVYKIKTKVDGTMDHYEAQLEAISFTQVYNIDYDEIFAPVACLTFACSHLVVAVVKCWTLFQKDVKNAFLSGDLKKKFILHLLPDALIRLIKCVAYIERCMD